jgi:hypothetical protein
MVTGWVLLTGLRLTSRAFHHGALRFLLGDDDGIVRKACDLLDGFPREKARIERHVRFVTLAPGASELRLPARLAFVTEAMGRSAQEFVIELHELAVIGWHAEIGGGLESTSRGVIERSTLRMSERFAERVLEVLPDELVGRRVHAEFQRRRSET